MSSLWFSFSSTTFPSSSISAIDSIRERKRKKSHLTPFLPLLIRGQVIHFIILLLEANAATPCRQWACSVRAWLSIGRDNKMCFIQFFSSENRCTRLFDLSAT